MKLNKDGKYLVNGEFTRCRKMECLKETFVSVCVSTMYDYLVVLCSK